ILRAFRSDERLPQEIRSTTPGWNQWSASGTENDARRARRPRRKARTTMYSHRAPNILHVRHAAEILKCLADSGGVVFVNARSVRGVALDLAELLARFPIHLIAACMIARLLVDHDEVAELFADDG